MYYTLEIVLRSSTGMEHRAIDWFASDTIQELYEMIFTEYELREKRGESLTPQRNYCDYPTRRFSLYVLVTPIARSSLLHARV